jgi:uncharacterized membrane protein
MRSHLARLYYRIRYSIGYYPTIIAVAYFAFALMVVSLPGSGFWQPLKPFLEWSGLPRVYNDEVVLSTLITGIISFVTLSFAMVMVVLSNVSTTFSPKLLLGLATEKTHQVVLGNYIGAILYCLILLLTISDGGDYRFKDLSIILAAALAIWCLVLFIYFIHNISTSVQINSIVEKIYNRTRAELYRLQRTEKDVAQPQQAPVNKTILPRHVFPSRESGYLQKIDANGLVKIARENNLLIRVYPQLGDFVIRDYPFFACTETSEKIDVSVLDRIYSAFTFFAGEKIEVNERYGFSQLMEIAVKSLSPGINDPGTACICIDYLTDLLVLWTELKHPDVYYDPDQNPRLIVKALSFETLFAACIGPIRRYGKHDLLIADHLLRCFMTLSHFDRKETRYRSFLNALALGVIEDVRNSSTTSKDLETINERIREMNENSEGYFSQLHEFDPL